MSGTRLLPVAVVAALLCGVAPRRAEAQYDAPPPPAAYALENVTVVGADGSRTDSVNIVVRGGLIQAMAPGAAIPPDARVLEGDSLFVYPGLVDAEGTAEVEWPEARDGEDDPPAWAPPRSRQGFLPHRRVADYLVAVGDDLAQQRARGVVAALVHPSGGLAPGQPAVLVHRASAGAPWELVASESAGLTLAFQSASGVYPSQLFGVIAYLRQAFLDAERYEAVRAAYAADPRGMIAPGWDPDHEALQAAARREAPVFFRADGAEDIRRAFDLQDQFGFGMVVVGGDEAWKVAGELVSRQVPVLVSLDFPSPSDWDPDADTVPGELKPDQVREKERFENLWSNAGRLERAGVTFALTSGGGTGDLLEGARKAVEFGLSPEGAVAALTTAPAALLGLTEMTRVEPGMAATFVVTDGELLGEDTKVTYAFLEGALEEASGGGSGGSGEAPAANLGGEWAVDLDAAGQAMEVTLTLEQSEDGSLTGRMTGGDMPPTDVEGSISGSSVTLRLQAEGLPEPIVLTGSVSEDGTSITGSGSTPFGEVNFTATKRPGFLGGSR
ncbi:MAG TPA: hypothetical protein VGA70_09760 [Longimicrobiales bacterium]|jgi:imidazolonepropionase-like amidohydrolase